MIQVIDSGMGISPEKSDLLFQPFKLTADNSLTQQAGSGLGLSISKQLIALHGGDLEIDSNLAAASQGALAGRVSIVEKDIDRSAPALQ